MERVDGKIHTEDSRLRVSRWWWFDIVAGGAIEMALASRGNCSLSDVERTTDNNSAFRHLQQSEKQMAVQYVAVPPFWFVERGEPGEG